MRCQGPGRRWASEQPPGTISSDKYVLSSIRHGLRAWPPISWLLAAQGPSSGYISEDKNISNIIGFSSFEFLLCGPLAWGMPSLKDSVTSEHNE